MSAQLDPFHAIAISRLAHRLQSEGRSVIHMEFGQPSTGAPRAAIARAQPGEAVRSAFVTGDGRVVEVD